MLYCYVEKIGLRRHSNKEVLWVAPEGRLTLSRFKRETRTWYHYYASVERHEQESVDNDIIASSDSLGYHINTCPKDKYKVGPVENTLGIKHVYFVTSYDDVESFYQTEEKNPKDYQDWFLSKLVGEDPQTIREYYPEACYIVTRSDKPIGKTPWKRCGRRSYLWLVSLEEKDFDKGRRIEWGGDTTLYPNRKEALKALYSA